MQIVVAPFEGQELVQYKRRQRVTSRKEKDRTAPVFFSNGKANVTALATNDEANTCPR